jgi:hypothetical protein
LVLGVDFEEFVFVFFSEKFDPIGLLGEVGVEMMFEFGETGEIILLVPVWEIFALVGVRRITQQ